MRLFRKFRKVLLKEGKMKSYIVYALGEILLIVIGILIAWKINNLNEIRKNKIVQVKIYESLYEELNTNLKVLDSSIVRYNSSVRSMQNTLNAVGLESNELTQDTKDLIVQIKFRNTNLRDEALSSVNMTDKFQFIGNDSLIELIAQYPTQLKSFEDQDMKIRGIVDNRLKPNIEKHISLIDMLPKENENYNHIRTFGQKSNYMELLNSRDYQNSIIDCLAQTNIQLLIGSNLRKKTETLAIKLKQELGE
ncbi:MAG: hypothetical protein ACSHXF_12840 [Aquaticitalea sp.]